jgi:hypothetical protein
VYLGWLTGGERSPDMTDARSSVLAVAATIILVSCCASCTRQSASDADRTTVKTPAISLRSSTASSGLPAAPTRPAPSKPTQDDEAFVRSEFDLPASARLVSLSAKPLRAGFFGREGLRTTAVFQFSPEDAKRFRDAVAAQPGWSSLPIPIAVRQLRDPPTELPNASHGLAYCRLGVWKTGTEFTPHPCAVGERADHYRTAVLDLDTLEMTVVLKNYY